MVAAPPPLLTPINVLRTPPNTGTAMLALFAVTMLFMPTLPTPGASQPLQEAYAALPGAGAARRIALLGSSGGGASQGGHAANSTADDWWGAHEGWHANATAVVLEPGSHAASVALQHLQVARVWIRDVGRVGVNGIMTVVVHGSRASHTHAQHTQHQPSSSSLSNHRPHCTIHQPTPPQDASSTALVWDPSLAATHPAILDLMPQWASLPALLGAPLAADGLLAPLECDKVLEVHASSLPDPDKLRRQVAVYAASLESKGRAVPLPPVGGEEAVGHGKDEPWQRTVCRLVVADSDVCVATPCVWYMCSLFSACIVVGMHAIVTLF